MLRGGCVDEPVGGICTDFLNVTNSTDKGNENEMGGKGSEREGKNREEKSSSSTYVGRRPYEVKGHCCLASRQAVLCKHCTE